MTKQEAITESERDGIGTHAVYMRRLRQRLLASGKTTEGKVRRNKQHPQLAGLKDRHYHKMFMRQWRGKL